MTSISFSKKLRKNAHKCCENVSFCFCMDQKDVAKNVCEVNQELGVGNRPPREKKLQITGGVPGGGTLLKKKNTSTELLLPSKYQLLNFPEMT